MHKGVEVGGGGAHVHVCVVGGGWVASEQFDTERVCEKGQAQV